MRSYSTSLKTSADNSVSTIWDTVGAIALKSVWVIFAFTAPLQPILLTVFIMVFADTSTAVWAAIRNDTPVTSSGLRRTLSKLAIYSLLIVTAFLIDQNILGQFAYLTKVVSGYIGIVEFTSIVENSNKILGQNIFHMLIKKLGSHNDKEGNQK